MKKLLCFLGFHKWKEDGLAHYYEYFYQRERCPARKVVHELYGKEKRIK